MGGNFIPHTIQIHYKRQQILRLCGGNIFALSSPLNLVSSITLRLSFPPAVSIDICLLLFIKSWKKKPWKVLLTSAGGNAQFKKMQNVRHNILIRRPFSIKKNLPWNTPSINSARCLIELPGGGGVLPMMAYTVRLRPKGLPNFFRLQVYERVGISLVEVCKKLGKSLLWVCKRAPKG